MSNKQFQELLQDVLIYLQDFEEDYIETNSDYFNSDLKKLSTKNQLQNNSIDQKKSNFNIQNALSTTLLDKKNIQEPKTPLKTEPIAIPSSDNNKNIEVNEIKKTQVIKKIAEEDLRKKEVGNKLDLAKDSSDKKIIENKTIIRDKKPKIFEDDLSDIKKTIQKVFPNINIVSSLDDKIAKQKAKKYKLKNIAAPITILAYKENEKHYRFLEKIAIAMHVYFYPTKVVSEYLLEKEKSGNDFLSDSDIFLIIASDYTIFELPNLRTYYKENPIKGEKHLKNKALFLLPDISLYLKEPTLKTSLFKALKQKIQNLNDEICKHNTRE
ncbi:MAG: hypothetical protein KR126chlam6_00642 [Candidatus Anoxychlamydiales bacterium]|nr:hypothetical protein [Candidatus Anoxychlamydiales bacterium]